ncbi:MAG TPA: PhzF family phenazine biosynthesis protein [Polyangiales bacterium]|nr:PhzF family phenazine biosynthesis protein [Polyangiales bacterium]
MVLLHLVDAFAERPFTGNPAAVCLLDRDKTDEWMQNLAFELGYSETAFVTRRDNMWQLRWFSPSSEVRLCGHATLASAHVLWSLGRAQGPIEFATLSGVLKCERDARGIAIDLPCSKLEDAPPPVGFLSALGVRPLALKRTDQDDYVAELESEDAVAKLAPDLAALAQVKARGICVTSRAKDPELDFVSRFFAPAFGIPEDPVTGSAHCALAPLWAARLGKTKLRARQLSRRGGVLDVELVGDRVRLAGRAVTVFTGALTV